MIATPRADRLPPSGTVTFLFTDIEGSTRLWETQRATMQQALAHHDAIMRDAIEANDGYLVKTTGDGAHAAFAIASDAIAACLAAQRALKEHAWGELSIKSRMALHSGAAEQRDGDYYGPALNRAARLMAAAHGGQILLSLATAELVRDDLPADIALRDMGERRLKDLAHPERVYQVIAPGLPADFPPLKTLDARPNNLPAQTTPFIGEHAIRAVKEQLSNAKVRLLTFSGVGGAGKTRLALQAAADMVDDFEHGVFFVPLAALSDSGLVLPTIAKAFDVREAAGRSLQEQLQDYLREKQMLLMLDNFEQVIDAAPLVTDLLTAAPRLKVLVTSREVLRLSGETDYPVPPLSLPDPKRLPPLERLTRYEAVALFIERAVAVKPAFAVTNDNALAVAEICHRLDGLPLAIELAAARVRVLPPQRMLAELSHRLSFVMGGARDLPPRQKTLRAAIDWSHDLLTGDEQKLFRRLAVFVGGCALEAIEAICNIENDLHVLDTLESLVDKSLVTQTEAAGEPRFAMLETIREYAGEKLTTAGDDERVRERHRDYFLALAEEAAGAHVTGENLRHWSPLLQLESDNLRTALKWSIDKPTEAQAALRLCGALRSFWWRSGRASEGRDWCDKTLGRASSAEPTKPLLEALIASGVMQCAIGDLTAATSAYERALALSRELHAAALEGEVLRRMANVKMSLGQIEAAQSMYHQSIAIHRTLGDLSPEAASLTCLASLLINEGKLVAAEAPLERALMLSQQLGDLALEAYNVSRLGSVAQYQSDYALANIRHERALAIARDLGIQELELEQLRHLGEVAVGCGEFEKARLLFRASLALSRDQDSWFAIRECVDAIVALATATKSFEVATKLSSAVERLRRTMAAPRFPIDQERFEANRAQCRAELGNGRYESAIAAGRTLQPNDAIAAAMAWLEQG